MIIKFFLTAAIRIRKRQSALPFTYQLSRKNEPYEVCDHRRDVRRRGSIQQNLQTNKVSVANIDLAPGVDESPMCRLNGPVKVAPGRTIPQYVKDAFQEELLMAQAYDVQATPIEGRIDELAFSSVAPAYWKIKMTVTSPANLASYSVDVNFPFDTSWTAYSACRNVADAFGPAVQELLKQVVTNPQFSHLAAR